jgi:hypothetical protein
LNVIKSWELTKDKEAEFLSILLNRSHDNIEDDLTNIYSDKSPITTKPNYQFLVNTFESIGLQKAKEQSESILKNLPKKG